MEGQWQAGEGQGKDLAQPIEDDPAFVGSQRLVLLGAQRRIREQRCGGQRRGGGRRGTAAPVGGGEEEVPRPLQPKLGGDDLIEGQWKAMEFQWKVA